MIEKDQQPREDDQHSGSSRTKQYVLSDDEPGLLVRPEVRQVQLPGNERVRFVLPRKPALRRVRRGVLEATAVTHVFFQAEDGIRDYKVTGVQTCALPICPRKAIRGGTTGCWVSR